MRKDLVLIGRITGAHGIKGEVKLQSFAADPEAIARYGALHTERGETIEIEKLRPQKQSFVAILKGVRDRNRAEALQGTGLYVERAKLPAPEEGEVYIHDLVGLAVHTRGGNLFGKVVDVANFGAGDLLEIERPGVAATLLVPFSDEFVPVIDLTAARITLDLPQGYLDEQ